jgi:hypothetical protein
VSRRLMKTISVQLLGGKECGGTNMPDNRSLEEQHLVFGASSSQPGCSGLDTSRKCTAMLFDKIELELRWRSILEYVR